MATSLTFGNPLKFGPDSCHNAKGRQIPSSTERESTQSLVRTTPSYREGPSNGAPCVRELSPLRVVEQGPATMVVVFPPRSDRGWASTIFLMENPLSKEIFFGCPDDEHKGVLLALMSRSKN